MMGVVKTAILLNAALVTGPGAVQVPLGCKRTFQATGFTSAGTGASTIGVEVSNDGITYVEKDELSLTLGTTITSDDYYLDAPWKYVRGNVKTISGTDAQVTLVMGIQV